MTSSSDIQLVSTGPNWHILGAGSIGGLFAIRLLQAGCSPQLILKDDRSLKEYRNAGGLSFKSGVSQQNFDIPAVSPGGLDQPIRRLLVTTKTYQTISALNALRSHLDSATQIVLLQNGMGIAEQIAERFPSLQLFVGTTTEGANRTGRWSILHAGAGETWIGSTSPKQTEDPTLLLPLRAQWDRQIQQRLWNKLAINCAINPLTVIYRCRNGQLAEIPEALKRIQILCEEIAAVSNATGRPNSAEQLYNITLSVIQSTASNRSSMLQDIENGNRTEIDSITGYICQRANELGIPCPANSEILNKIRMLEPA